MPWVGEQLRCVRRLGEVARVHDDDAIGDARHNTEVMCDEHDSGVEVASQTGDELENLRLDRHVERGGWLVGDQQLWIARERDGDHDALAHAAAELVGIRAQAASSVWNADGFHELTCPPAGFRLREAKMDLQGLDDLLLDTQHWIQARNRILKDHRDLPTANLAQLILAQLQQILVEEHDRALFDLGRWHRQQAQDRERCDTLARAALAHDAQRFAFIQRKADTLHRVDRAFARLELHFQVFDL